MYDAVLFPTDGSDGSATARDHAIELAADQGATLYVLYVVEPLAHVASVRRVVVEELTEFGAELVAEVAEAATERGVRAETAVIQGDPAATIVAHAAAVGADVIVMPTHGRSGVARAILGSVTEAVIRTGDVPVLVTKLET